MANHHVAPNGDIVFLLGPDQQRVQVHSIIMKTASPVFAAMLGPNFREGHDILASASNNQLAEITLPDDDFEAFNSICQVLTGLGI